MQRELTKKNDELTKSNDRNEKLQTEINDANEKYQRELNEKDETINGLEQSVEAKKTIRNYAGFAGDVLQSFGIKKEMIREPLTGILSGEEEETKQIPETTTQNDESGIVEEETVQNPQEEKRNELIALIGEYLQGTDNDTLSNIFYIFSEIERDKTKAIELIEYLKSLKAE